jgi:hypothetical protein
MRVHLAFTFGHRKWAIKVKPQFLAFLPVLLKKFMVVFLFLFICAYKAWVISPPFSHPFPYPLAPSLCSPPPRYLAETILPLSLLLLKKEYKQ